MLRRLLPLIFILPAACGRDNEPVLARVNGNPITAGMFRREMSELPPEQSTYLSTEPGKKEFLELMIRRQVIMAEAEKAGVARRPDIKEQLARLDAEVKRQHEAARERLIIGEFMRGLKEKDFNISEEDVRRAWETEKESKASHILVSDQALADEIKARIDKGESFETLAKKHSEDPTGKNGGDLGYVRKGSLVPEFENALFPLKQGEVSAPVSSPFGWHLIKKTGERALASQPFKDSAESVRSLLEKQKLQAWLDAARGRNDVSLNASALEKLSAAAPSPAAPQ